MSKQVSLPKISSILQKWKSAKIRYTPFLHEGLQLLLKQQLDKVAQNMVIYEWGEDQLFSEAESLRQIIDLWDKADKTQYFL